MECMPKSSLSSVFLGWMTITTCTLYLRLISLSLAISVSCSQNFLNPSACSDSMNCSVSSTTTWTLCFSIEQIIVERILSIFWEPWKFMKCNGSLVNPSAKQSNFYKCLSILRSLYWYSIDVIKIQLRIQKLPQRTVISFLQRSKVNCERKVVFPLPVGPDITVSSPMRIPLTTLLKKGSQDIFTPQFCSVLLILLRISPLIASKLRRLPSGMVFALFRSSAISYGFYLRKSFASFRCQQSCFTTYVLLMPIFSTILEVLRMPASSLSIHKITFQKSLRQGRRDSERLVAPWGRDREGIPVFWQTAMASNSPSVSTIVLSVSLTRLSPKNPRCPPAGDCFIYFLLILPFPRILTFTISDQLLLQKQLLVPSFCMPLIPATALPSFSFFILQAGKQMHFTLVICPSLPKNSSQPAPTLYFFKVSSVKPLYLRYSTTSLNSSFSRFDLQIKYSTSDNLAWPLSSPPPLSKCSYMSVLNPSIRSLKLSQEP